MSYNKGWIGVDLDGTLAHYDGWLGISHIGKPIPLMVEKVRELIKQGHTIKIFTARVANPNSADFLEINYNIERWCVKHLGLKLEITATKDFGMISLYDDRCIQIIPNTGMTVLENFIKDIPTSKHEQDQQHQSTESGS